MLCVGALSEDGSSQVVQTAVFRLEDHPVLEQILSFDYDHIRQNIQAASDSQGNHGLSSLGIAFTPKTAGESGSDTRAFYLRQASCVNLIFGAKSASQVAATLLSRIQKIEDDIYSFYTNQHGEQSPQLTATKARLQDIKDQLHALQQQPNSSALR
jgi:hypothetical protein